MGIGWRSFVVCGLVGLAVGVAIWSILTLVMGSTTSFYVTLALFGLAELVILLRVKRASHS